MVIGAKRTPLTNNQWPITNNKNEKLGFLFVFESYGICCGFWSNIAADSTADENRAEDAEKEKRPVFENDITYGMKASKTFVLGAFYWGVLFLN